MRERKRPKNVGNDKGFGAAQVPVFSYKECMLFFWLERDVIVDLGEVGDAGDEHLRSD